MDRDRRRVLIVGILSVLVLGALFVAWWLTPAPDDADLDDDMVWTFPPVRGVQAPPVPPPPAHPDDTDGSADEDLIEDATAIVDALGVWLDSDLPLDPDAEPVERTDDGWPLATPIELWRDSALPADGQVVALLVLPDGDVLAESRRDDGSVVLLRSAEGAGPPLVLRLDGVPDTALAAAHARSPALSDRGPVVVAEDAQGRSRVWSVDPEAGSATAQTREGLDRTGGGGADLDLVVASGPFLAASWRRSGVAVRRVDGAAGWLVLDEGPVGIGAVDVRAVGGEARLLYTRNGRLLELTPNRTVPDTLVRAGARDPVELTDRRLWVEGDRLAGDPAVPRERVASIAGRDLVRGPEGRSAAWVGGDGRVRVLPDFAAVDTGLGRITAIGVARDGSTTVLAVAGRRGAVAEVVVVRL